jgi:hypothetical protein
MGEGGFDTGEDRPPGSDLSRDDSPSGGPSLPPRFLADKKFMAQMRAANKDHRTDHEAREIIGAFLKDGEPFVLYLRNFQEEAYDALIPGTDLDPKDRLIAYGGLSTFEGKLAAAFEGKVKAITAANPSDFLFRGLFPRLELSEYNWGPTIDWLIDAASFIVFELDSFAPGVVRELDLIHRHAREFSTVIVIPSAGAADEDPVVRTLMGSRGGTLPDYEKPDAQSPGLSRFSRVVREDAVPFSDLASSQLFADLLPGYSSAGQSQPDSDTLRRRGDLANRWGVLRHEAYIVAGDAAAVAAIETVDPGSADAVKAAGDVSPDAAALLALVLADDDALAAVDEAADRNALSEALDSLYLSVRHFFDAGDNAGQAGALMNIGRVFLEADRYDDAIAAFKDSGTISKRDEGEAGEGGFRQAVAWVAFAHLLDGDLQAANALAFHVLELERDSGETVATIDALKVLQRLYAQVGEQESEQNVIADLEVATHRIKNQVRLGEYVPPQR